jgi:hypothetical protein
VSRFAVPVLAEQAEVIRAARATRMTKARIGLSATALGDSVYRNLAERGVFDSREELDKAWRARQLTEGMWLVTFKYSSRGRDNTATWEYDETTGALRSRGRVGTQLGFREGGRRPSTRSAASARPTRTTTTTTKKKAGTPTTARQSSSRQATKRVAAARRAAAARMVSEAEKATRRNAAVAREALKKPIVIPPRRVAPPPEIGHAVESLLFEEPLEPPKAWGQELELEWEQAPPISGDELDAELEQGDESDDEESEREPGLDVDPEEEAELDDDEESEAELEEAPEPEAYAAPPARPVRRREPLRARPRVGDGLDSDGGGDAESTAERARRRVRVRATGEPDDAGHGGNGPVFRADLTQQANEVASFPRAAVRQSPEPPLSMPLQPIEPPPRRRRLRPLRGR